MTKEEFLNLPELKLGDKRNFDNEDKIFSIRLIVFPNPDITMNWTWTTRIDRVTKQRITQNRIHTFYRIELLGDINIKDEDLIIDDIYLLGFSLDGRLMMIPIDCYDNVFSQIDGFQKIKDSLSNGE